MEIVRGIKTRSRPFTKTVVTIGNFDGIHVGHQRIIQTAIEQARASGALAGAFTFRPHPQTVLRPETSMRLLTSYEEKLRLMAELGLDFAVEEPFSREFSVTPAQEFFNDVLLRRLNARGVVVGYDFAFGNMRKGQLDILQGLCDAAGVKLTVVQPFRVGDEIASSSRIRQYLAAGEIEGANRLLGRRFSITGDVVKGDQRGRQLGFPTANIRTDQHDLLLPFGVYATYARAAGGKPMKSVTNIGTRPTFHDSSLALIETHILDESVDLYGTSLEVAFVRRLRSEAKFPGIEALKAQIVKDIAEARQTLAP